MKRKLLIVSATAIFTALVLWITGLSHPFYLYNMKAIDFLVKLTTSLF
ncbi:MAG: hypothetical protein ACOX2F_01725 [bacterium]